ncbi:MAG TPA: hypothetical protein VNS33_00215 [Bradyrhizobium sp.]|nr:hypothetical protein [Bradyrhizobium sp.]
MPGPFNSHRIPELIWVKSKALGSRMLLAPRGCTARLLRIAPMTLYYFRIQNTSGGEVADLSTDLANHDAAWTELANVCGDLVRDATRSLRPNAHWQLELLDVAKKPLFRIRVVAESFGSDWRIT